MRNVAMEALLDPLRACRPVVSMEELELVACDGREDGYQAVAELQDVDRQFELADGLEDLAVIADQITNPTPINIELMASAAQLAVAGTDIDPQAIVPALESDAGSGQAAAQGLRARAAAITKRIWEILNSIYERIRSWIRGLTADAERMDRNLKNLDTKVDELAASGKPVRSGDFVVRSSPQFLNFGDSTPKLMAKASELLAVLETSRQIGDYVFGQHTKYILSKADDLAKIIESFDPAKPEEAVEKAIKAMKALSGAKLPGETKLGDINENYDTYASNVMMAGKMIQRQVWAPRAGGDIPPTTELERAARAQMVLVSGASVESFKAGDHKFSTMTTAEMKKVIEAERSVINAVLKYSGADDGSRKLDQARANLERSTKSAEAKFNKTENTAANVLGAWNSLTRLNVEFANWTIRPQQALNEHLLSSVRFASMLVSSSMSEYQA